MTPAERILELYSALHKEALKLLQQQLTGSPSLDEVREWLDALGGKRP